MNANKILVIVDMQQDFIDEDQQKIVPNVINLIEQAIKENWFILAVLDTHTSEGYLNSIEGRRLIPKHCLIGTKGHRLIPEISNLFENYTDYLMVPKIDSFGLSNVNKIKSIINNTFQYYYLSCYDKIEFHICGMFTNTSVLSTAISLQNYFVKSEIFIHQNACVASCPNLHTEALNIMKNLQMQII